MSVCMYPNALPYPLQSGFSFNFKPNVIRTTMADGYVRQRLVNQGAPSELKVNFLFTQEQYEQFISWYKTEIISGQNWFVLPVLNEVDGGIQYSYCRIQSGKLSVQLKFHGSEGSMWHVGVTLDVSNTVVDDGSWANYYDKGSAADVIASVNEAEGLHDAINGEQSTQIADIVGSTGNVSLVEGNEE